MDEPTRWTWASWSDRPDMVPSTHGEYLAHDDSVIVRWRRVYEACEKAGLLRKDGTLRPPECYWDEDGEACDSPDEDLDMSGDPGIVREYRPAYRGRTEWWGNTTSTEEGMRCVGPFATEEEVRAATLPKEDE